MRFAFSRMTTRIQFALLLLTSSGKEWSSDATAEMFSLDNVDDVAPLGPTNVSVTGVMATDNSVFEDAGAGSYTVGGLVDKYDDAVNSPVATFTVEPTARSENLCIC